MTVSVDREWWIMLSTRESTRKDRSGEAWRAPAMVESDDGVLGWLEATMWRL